MFLYMCGGRVLLFHDLVWLFFFSSRRRHTRCALVTGVQTCALPISVNITERPFAEVIAEKTGGWGADVVFEASGSPKAFAGLFDLVRPGGAEIGRASCRERVCQYV